MMMLYSAPNPAPNPRRVRIFLAEKRASIPITDVAIPRREHKSPEHMARNSLGQVPTLELDDGTMLSESVSICRYLESVFPEPPLFGRDAREAALIDMWIRRIEFAVMSPVANFWRHAHPFTAKVVTPQYTEFGESNRTVYESQLKWLDRELAGQSFIAGSDFTMADIAAVTTVDFAEWIGLSTPENLKDLLSWRDRVRERPSASA